MVWEFPSQSRSRPVFVRTWLLKSTDDSLGENILRVTLLGAGVTGFATREPQGP